MDSSRQVLRWSIPGLLFVLVILSLHLAQVSLIYRTSPSVWLTGVEPAGLVGAALGGIPLGFVIYQLYYSTYSSHRSLRHRLLFLRADRGALALAEMLRLGMPPDVLTRVAGPEVGERCLESVRCYSQNIDTSGSRWLPRLWSLRQHICESQTDALSRCVGCQERYASDFVANWCVYQTLIDVAADRGPNSVAKFEYTSGSDLYHALGAGRRAVSLAAVGAVAYAAFTLFAGIAPTHDLGGTRGWVVWLVIVASTWGAVWQTFTVCRRNVDISYRRRVASYLALVTREHPNILFEAPSARA